MVYPTEPSLQPLFPFLKCHFPNLLQKAGEGRRTMTIVLDPKRSNAINIGLTTLPPVHVIKAALLNFDEFAVSKDGIEKLLTMMPTEEERQKIEEAQLANPDVPLGPAENFLMTLASIGGLAARLQLWAFKLDYESMERVPGSWSGIGWYNQVGNDHVA